MEGLEYFEHIAEEDNFNYCDKGLLELRSRLHLVINYIDKMVDPDPMKPKINNFDFRVTVEHVIQNMKEILEPPV